MGEIRSFALTADVDALLTNWGAWARERKHPGHCGSIEHRYRMKMRADSTPTGWGDWLNTPPARSTMPIDAIAALAVERVMRYVPKDHRTALKLRYVYQMPRKMMSQRLAMQYDTLDRFLGDAHHMVSNLLTRHNSERTISPQFDNPLKNETLATDVARRIWKKK